MLLSSFYFALQEQNCRRSGKKEVLVERVLRKASQASSSEGQLAQSMVRVDVHKYEVQVITYSIAVKLVSKSI